MAAHIIAKACDTKDHHSFDIITFHQTIEFDMMFTILYYKGLFGMNPILYIPSMPFPFS